MSSTTETGLSTAQGNALVYSSLSAFLLVGLYAGYRTKTKVDFLSGIRTQSAFPLALNWIASNMSSSLFFGYPQLAVIPQAGILGLAAYAFSSCVPLFAFAFLGPYIRRICPEGFTLAEFIRQRFGLPVGILASVIFVAFMLCFMITELNTFGGVVNLLGGVNPTISALIVAITTTIYTAYGGFKASLWTDNVNAIVIAIFVIMMCVAVGVEVNIDTSRISESGLLKPQRLGGELWYILTVAIVFSQMFNQGFWQRAFASKTNQVLWKSVLIAVVPLFAIIFLIGMAGPIAQWAGLFNGPTAEDDGSYTFFYLLSTLPTWVHGIVIVLAGALTSSAYDTLQSAQISTIQNDVFVGKVDIWWCRLVLLLLNIPAVVLAVKNVDILEVFLIADLGAASVLPAPLLGLIPGLYWLNGFDVFIGAIGGFFTVFIFGTIFYHGDAYAGVSLIALPQGLYIEDYSVLGAFFAAPLGSIGWTFVAFAFRALITLAWCRFKGQEYKVFERKEWDTRKFALDEDRPAELKNGEEGDENRLGLESTTSDDVHKDGGESKSDEVLDGGFLHSNKDHDFSFDKLKQKLFNRNGGSQ